MATLSSPLPLSVSIEKLTEIASQALNNAPVQFLRVVASKPQENPEDKFFLCYGYVPMQKVHVDSLKKVKGIAPAIPKEVIACVPRASAVMAQASDGSAFKALQYANSDSEYIPLPTEGVSALYSLSPLRAYGDMFQMVHIFTIIGKNNNAVSVINLLGSNSSELANIVSKAWDKIKSKAPNEGKASASMSEIEKILSEANFSDPTKLSSAGAGSSGMFSVQTWQSLCAVARQEETAGRLDKILQIAPIISYTDKEVAVTSGYYEERKTLMVEKFSNQEERGVAVLKAFRACFMATKEWAKQLGSEKASLALKTPYWMTETPDMRLIFTGKSQSETGAMSFTEFKKWIEEGDEVIATRTMKETQQAIVNTKYVVAKRSNALCFSLSVHDSKGSWFDYPPADEVTMFRDGFAYEDRYVRLEYRFTRLQGKEPEQKLAEAMPTPPKPVEIEKTAEQKAIEAEERIKALQKAGQEARANAALEKHIRYNGVVMTLRELTEKLVSEGYRPEIKEYTDDNAIMKAHDKLARLSSNGMQNINAKEIERVKEEIENMPKKKKYRLSSNTGTFIVASKAEYDYAQALIAKA